MCWRCCEEHFARMEPADLLHSDLNVSGTIPQCPCYGPLLRSRCVSFSSHARPQRCVAFLTVRSCDTVPSIMVQALDKQDEQIEELERIAEEKQQELIEASRSVEQHASSMKRVWQYHSFSFNHSFACSYGF